MNNTKFEVNSLPDIEMYGGDTSPWEVALVKEDGTSISADMISAYIITLTLTPLKTTTGIGTNVSAVAPIFEKVAEISVSLNGDITALFTFNERDTKGLRGKFLYQIEFKCGNDLRVCQGCLYIKQNINR